MRRSALLTLLLALLSVTLMASVPADTVATRAKKAKRESSVQLHGAFQTDALVPKVDSAIGATQYDGPFLSNTYMNLNLTSTYVNAGARLELMHKPLPGYEADFAGGGVQGIYVSGGYKYFNVTLGDIYDQFGSGMLFRAYEDRTLGVDNSIRGGRITLTPYDGIEFKAVGGMQRQYFNFSKENAFGFDYSKNAMFGFNLDLDLDQWIDAMKQNDYHLRIGGDFVSKYNPDDTIIPNAQYAYRLNLPRFVGAGEARIDFSHAGWRAMAEYAYKANDPTAQNQYIYRPGQALFLSLGYSQKGMSILAQAKRSDNMFFRSDRGYGVMSGNLNNMPAFGFTHTYICAANLPYATQADGEWAFQLEFAYRFQPKTALGGRYGTNIKLSGVHVRGLKKVWGDKKYGSYAGTDGYTTTFFGMGDEYYTDVHIDFDKKFTKNFSLIVMYMYQRYNQEVIKQHAGAQFLQAHTVVTDFHIRCNRNVNLRLEAQYQYTNQNAADYAEMGFDYGQNVCGVAELSLYKDFMITLSDNYFFRSQINYYNITFVYTHGAHRVQLAWIRAKDGYNCSGGVCRHIPAQSGLTLGYSVQF